MAHEVAKGSHVVHLSVWQQMHGNMGFIFALNHLKLVLNKSRQMKN